MSSAGLALVGPVLAIPRSLVPVSGAGALTAKCPRFGLPWTLSELPWNTWAPADRRPKKSTKPSWPVPPVKLTSNEYDQKVEPTGADKVGPLLMVTFADGVNVYRFSIPGLSALPVDLICSNSTV